MSQYENRHAGITIRTKCVILAFESYSSVRIYFAKK